MPSFMESPIPGDGKSPTLEQRSLDHHWTPLTNRDAPYRCPPHTGVEGARTSNLTMLGKSIYHCLGSITVQFMAGFMVVCAGMALRYSCARDVVRAPPP